MYQASGSLLDFRSGIDSHGWPPIDPRNLVPAKLLLSIGVSDVRVDVVVVKDPAIDRIVVNTLSARSVNIVVRWKNDGATALLAGLAGSIDLDVVNVHSTLWVIVVWQLTNPPVRVEDLQTLILYSSPGAGRLVSRPQHDPAEKKR